MKNCKICKLDIPQTESSDSPLNVFKSSTHKECLLLYKKYTKTPFFSILLLSVISFFISIFGVLSAFSNDADSLKTILLITIPLVISLISFISLFLLNFIIKKMIQKRSLNINSTQPPQLEKPKDEHQ